MQLTNSFLYVSKKPYEFELSIKGDIQPDNILKVLKESISLLKSDLLQIEHMIKSEGPQEEVKLVFNIEENF